MTTKWQSYFLSNAKIYFCTRNSSISFLKAYFIFFELDVGEHPRFYTVPLFAPPLGLLVFLFCSFESQWKCWCHELWLHRLQNRKSRGGVFSTGALPLYVKLYCCIDFASLLFLVFFPGKVPSVVVFFFWHLFSYESNLIDINFDQSQTVFVCLLNHVVRLGGCSGSLILRHLTLTWRGGRSWVSPLDPQPPWCCFWWLFSPVQRPQTLHPLPYLTFWHRRRWPPPTLSAAPTAGVIIFATGVPPESVSVFLCYKYCTFG